jgi:uncharacterized membrane protein YdbT with pleckstrin-like domain
VSTSTKCPSCGRSNAPGTPACICGYLFERTELPRSQSPSPAGGYVQGNLLPGERVVHAATMHWFIYAPGSALIVLAVYFWIAGRQDGTIMIGVFAFPLGLVLMIKAWIQQATTELAVTSKRVVAKVGLISRNTVELNHSKVESLSVDQSVLGRIFGFGTIVISGTGGGKTPIPNIDSPLQFRREAMRAIDTSQSAHEPTIAAGQSVASKAPDEKTCPQCAELVKAAAKICRFCGHKF